MTWTLKDRPNFSDPATRRRLKPRRGAYYHLISYGRALGYRKYHKHKGCWEARARNKNGRYIVQRLGPADDYRGQKQIKSLTFEQALEAANRWFEESPKRESFGFTKEIFRRAGIPRPSDALGYTICHAMHEYLAWKKMTLAKVTIDEMISTINFHIIPPLGDLPVSEFNGDTYRKFLLNVIETPPGRHFLRSGPRPKMDELDRETLRRRKKRANRVACILRDALKMAWENARTENVRAWKAIRTLRESARPRIVYLDRDECRRLVSHCYSDIKRLVLGALYTGCRATELLNMNVEDFAREGYGISVHSVKGARPRFVFLPDEGMAFFMALTKGKKPEDPIFSKDNSTQTRMSVTFQKRFREVVLAAGLPAGFTFHGLRHTYASRLVAAGAPLKVISDQLGHATITMVSQIYGHLAPQIRESEVRQRFESINAENAKLAEKSKVELMRLRKSLYGRNWRQYAVITAVSPSKSRHHSDI